MSVRKSISDEYCCGTGMLYTDKKDCCGCSACVNICPEQAISLREDKEGFLYPFIDKAHCVGCNLCKNVCAFQNIPVTAEEPLVTYVAINKNQATLISSASGGIFGALASLVFEKNGAVFGCAFNNEIEPEHICIENKADIRKLQGSKYVQSNVGKTYTEVQKYLKQGRTVLYTGTPCQIAGLKSYLGKDYENLFTSDLICHGVPSAAFFKGYIKYLEVKLKGKINDFKFRDKSYSGVYTGLIIYKKKNGAVREELIAPVNSYYYDYFLKGDICRENCYRCKYAGGSRQGDFTMGDYWGIEKAHPEIDTKNGVSVLLVNSTKGMTLISKLSKYLSLTPSTFESARADNEQLRQPIAESIRREAILKTWREGGYQAVADEYYRINKKAIMKYRIKTLVPQPVKNVVKRIIGRK